MQPKRPCESMNRWSPLESLPDSRQAGQAAVVFRSCVLTFSRRVASSPAPPVAGGSPPGKRAGPAGGVKLSALAVFGEVISATPRQSVKVARSDADRAISPRQPNGLNPRYFDSIMKCARRDRKLPGRSRPAIDKRTIRRRGFAALQNTQSCRPTICWGRAPGLNHVLQSRSLLFHFVPPSFLGFNNLPFERRRQPKRG
jgi:hypothetical protein